MIDEVEKLARGMAVVTYDALDVSEHVWVDLEQFLVEDMLLSEVRDGVFSGSVDDDASFHNAVKHLSAMIERESAGQVFIWYYDDRGDFYRFAIS